jgi:hypothetical protein
MYIDADVANNTMMLTMTVPMMMTLNGDDSYFFFFFFSSLLKGFIVVSISNILLKPSFKPSTSLTSVARLGKRNRQFSKKKKTEKGMTGMTWKISRIGC